MLNLCKDHRQEKFHGVYDNCNCDYCKLLKEKERLNKENKELRDKLYKKEMNDEPVLGVHEELTTAFNKVYLNHGVLIKDAHIKWTEWANEALKGTIFKVSSVSTSDCKFFKVFE